ncbi:hypothetical protein BLOT_010337 [Blomia tropicalis]|nr:hypothetical protein BLOT_010337 [Blomia tropicalis]
MNVILAFPMIHSSFEFTNCIDDSRFMCVFELYSNIRLAHVYNCNPLYHNVFEMNKYPNVVGCRSRQ